MNSLSLFCRYSQNDVFVNSGVRCRLKSQPLPTRSTLTWNIFLSLEVRELGDRSPYSFYGLFTFSWLSDAASLMIHIALFHWRPKGDRCCKHQSLLPRFVRRVWRMLPFCIDDPADLHIAYIAAAGFGSFSLMARSNTLLLQMALPCSPFQCCRQLEIDVIDASSCVSVFVVSSLSLLGTTHGVMVSWMILVSCVWCSVLRNRGIFLFFYVCALYLEKGTVNWTLRIAM